jgi:hypothetical protein
MHQHHRLLAHLLHQHQLLPGSVAQVGLVAQARVLRGIAQLQPACRLLVQHSWLLLLPAIG